MHTKFSFENRKGRDHSERLRYKELFNYPSTPRSPFLLMNLFSSLCKIIVISGPRPENNDITMYHMPFFQPGHFIPQFTTIKWAMCVPAICSSVDVEQTLVQALQDYNETTGVRFDVHVDPDMCYVKEETRHPLGTATVCTL